MSVNNYWKIEDDGNLAITKQTPLNYDEAYEVLKAYYNAFGDNEPPTENEVWNLVDSTVELYLEPENN